MTFNYFDIKDENDEDNSFSNEELNKKIYKKSFNERTNVSKKIKRIGFNMDQEFGKISKQYLAGVEPRLVELMKAVLKESGIKFVITCGIRTAEEQQRLYKEKKSNCDGVNHKSKHQANFRGLSEAVDIAVIDLTDKRKITWDIKYYYYVAGIFEAKAKAMGIKARWGGWFRGLEDGGHFELMD